jgi:hypothetical protein
LVGVGEVSGGCEECGRKVRRAKAEAETRCWNAMAVMVTAKIGVGVGVGAGVRRGVGFACLAGDGAVVQVMMRVGRWDLTCTMIVSGCGSESGSGSGCGLPAVWCSVGVALERSTHGAVLCRREGGRGGGKKGNMSDR